MCDDTEPVPPMIITLSGFKRSISCLQITQMENKYNVKLTNEEKKSVNYHNYTVGTTVKSLSNELEDVQTTEYRPGYIVRYTTFIPDPYAPNYLYITDGCCFHENVHRFGGDNRGFNWKSTRYRTRIDAYAIFYESGYTAFYDIPSVGRTTYYNKNGKLIGYDYANKSGMYSHSISKTSTAVSYSMYHSVGNPFEEKFPNIDYRYDATIYKSGSLTISGNHDQAPNHEIYFMTYPGDTISTVHQHKRKSFLYLFPTFPDRYFSYTL